MYIFMHILCISKKVLTRKMLIYQYVYFLYTEFFKRNRESLIYQGFERSPSLHNVNYRTLSRYNYTCRKIQKKAVTISTKYRDILETCLLLKQQGI